MGRISSLDVTSEYNVKDVITALRENRDRNKKDYDKAVEGYKESMRHCLEIELAKIEVGEMPSWKQANFGLEVPRDESDTYNKLIKNFSLVQDATVKLSMEDANKIFNDDWDWMEKSKFVNSTYLSSVPPSRG